MGENPLNSVQNVISVTGKSDMDVKPDVTTFSWSVESDGKTIDESSGQKPQQSTIKQLNLLNQKVSKKRY